MRPAFNLKYYERMSALLEALIAECRQGAIDCQAFLRKIVELTKKVRSPSDGASYPSAIDSPTKRALYDNLGRDEALARSVDRAVHESRQDDWRGNRIKTKRVKNAIRAALGGDDGLAEQTLRIVEKHFEY